MPDLPSPPPPKVEVTIGEVTVDIEAPPAPVEAAPRLMPPPPAPTRPNSGIWSGNRDLSRHYLRGR
ncbi:MAG: hypothetical protein AAFR17_00150 [Pseudomonadota bacterium]